MPTMIDREFQDVQMYVDATKEVSGQHKLSDSVLYSNIEISGASLLSNIAVSMAKIYSWYEQTYDFDGSDPTSFKIKVDVLPQTGSTYAFREGTTTGAFEVREDEGQWQTIAVHDVATLDANDKIPSSQLPIATTTSLGVIKVGENLSITAEGVLSAQSSGDTSSYIAGQGISITPAPTVQDMTDIEWEVGDITNGVDDDTRDDTLRSPLIEIDQNVPLAVTAIDTNDANMVWKAVFYDSTQTHLNNDTGWETYEDSINIPASAAYVRVVLMVSLGQTMTVQDLQSCEMQLPDDNMQVISNTGVIDIEYDATNKKIVANIDGTDTDIITFGSDLSVNNGVVDITDFNRLILNVEE